MAPLHALRPEAPAVLADLIAHCLDGRCRSVAAARPLLAAVPRPSRERYRGLARGVGDALCRSLRRDDPERPWPATAGLSTAPTNLHHGAAGMGLYRTALHTATGEPRYREAAEAAGRWILARLRYVWLQRFNTALRAGDVCRKGLHEYANARYYYRLALRCARRGGLFRAVAMAEQALATLRRR